MPIEHLSRADLFYVERGQGEPLVFLNGLAGDSLSWLSQLKYFGRRYHCLAVECRDVGQSSYATEPYTMVELAHDLAEFLESRKLLPAHIVGLSMGAMLAQELAILAPDRVASLVLVSAMAFCDEWFCGTLNAFELIRRSVADTATFFEAVMPWWVGHSFYEDSGRMSWLSWLLRKNPHAQRLDGFLRQVEAIRRHDARGRLGRIQCQALLVGGEEDRIVPLHYLERLAQLMPHAQRCAVPKVGHGLPIEDPPRFNRILEQFLEGLRRPLRHSA